MPAIAVLLSDENGLVRCAAASAIWKIDANCPEAKDVARTLTKLLKGGDAESRKQSIYTLIRMKPLPPGIVPALITSLKDNEQQVRYYSVLLLRMIGPEAKTAIPALVEVLKDKDTAIRMAAASLLWQFNPDGVEGKAAISAYAELLTEDGWQIRYNVARTLGSIGPKAAPAVPNLIKLLDEKPGMPRSEAIATLGRIGPGAKPAVPALIKELKVAEGDRLAAVCALEHIGPDAKDAVPALIELLKGELGGFAASALGGIGGEAKAAIPTLTEMLNGKRPDARCVAARRFAGLPATRSNTYRFSSICWTTRAEMDGVRSSRLITWGRSASRRLPFVVQVVRDKNKTQLARQMAVRALGRIGEVATPALKEMLQDKDESVRKAATEELAKIKKLKR